MSQVPKRERHLLTLADRKRGCAVARGRRGGKKAQASGNAHKLTREERRRGGLATAAKRREERTRKLLDMLRQPSESKLPDCTPSMRSETFSSRATRIMEQRAGLMEGLAARDAEGLLPAKRGSESPLGDPKDWVDVIPVADLPALGASLAGKLMAGEAQRLEAEREALAAPAPKLPPCDPFTLSALKRFRLGPRSPLELTRSQRAHVDLMREQGFLAATGDSMLALTEKGRQAIETEEVDHV